MFRKAGLKLRKLLIVEEPVPKPPPKKEIPECHIIDPRLVVGWPPAYPEPHPRYDVTDQYEDH